MKNGLYLLNTIFRLQIAYNVKPSVYFKLWHWQNGHRSLTNLKHLGNTHAIDIRKMKFAKRLLICQVCILLKQKKTPSYKLHTPLGDINDEIYINLMDSITTINCNKFKYCLIVTYGFSRCQ